MNIELKMYKGCRLAEQCTTKNIIKFKIKSMAFGCTNLNI